MTRLPARPIKVLFCIDRLTTGGTEKQLAALLRILDRDRIEPALCTLHPSSTDLSSLGCDFIELNGGAALSASAARRAIALRRYLRRHAVDVVHAFFQDPPMLAVAAALGGRRRPLVVASFRDLGFWHTPAKLRRMRWAYRLCDVFTANSRAVAEAAVASYGLGSRRVEVIYNGVAIPATRACGSGGDCRVAVVANLNRPVKRVDLFLEAAKVVLERTPNARFVVLGDGPLRPALEQRAAALGLLDALTFAGSVDDIADRLRTVDIGVMPSDSEGLSNAVLEYMAAGLPTVARAVGGNPEAVIDGVTGRLTADDRPASMAEAILWYLEHEQERRAHGDRAREVARDRFSLETCARRHQEFYAELVGPATGGSGGGA
jgi:glycosyltransferase involved in cell wall biosynthesis